MIQPISKKLIYYLTLLILMIPIQAQTFGVAVKLQIILALIPIKIKDLTAGVAMIQQKNKIHLMMLSGGNNKNNTFKIKF